MTYEQALAVRIGDTLLYEGRPCVVLSIRVRGIASPLFRAMGVDGLTSWELFRLP
jgi:hypothetical protein